MNAKSCSQSKIILLSVNWFLTMYLCINFATVTTSSVGQAWCGVHCPLANSVDTVLSWNLAGGGGTGIGIVEIWWFIGNSWQSYCFEDGPCIVLLGDSPETSRWYDFMNLYKLINCSPYNLNRPTTVETAGQDCSLIYDMFVFANLYLSVLFTVLCQFSASYVRLLS